MVKVREDHPIDQDGRINVPIWIENIGRQTNLSVEDSQRLQKTVERLQGWSDAFSEALSSEVTNLHSSKAQSPAEDVFQKALDMAVTLASLHLDATSLMAAVLFPAVDAGWVNLDMLKEDGVSDSVIHLLKAVDNMSIIASSRRGNSNAVFGKGGAEQSEKLRKMLVSMVDDVRVTLVKLSERLAAIRFQPLDKSDTAQQLVREIAEIYAPLAHRLGIGHIKWEMEDLAFRHQHPKDYKRIAGFLDEKRLARQKYIENVIDRLQTRLAKNNIRAEVMGRAKHIYSIWRKMQRKDISFSQVYDVRAVRILVYNVQDCYNALGVVHDLWRSMPGELDDYITNPKANGYQSLHTAVFGPEQRILEIQVRTQDMHDNAELGVCAHWRYKGTDQNVTTDAYEKKLAWLRQLVEWHDEVGGNPLADELSGDIKQDRIYVFTRDGHVVDLPYGSTPLDFAYRIHTDIGHSCRGAKVNGRIVPLSYSLKTAEQVEVLTSKDAVPSRDWLSPDSGCLTTSRARAKVQHWFKVQAREKNIPEGRAILEREFKRLALLDLDYDQLAKALHQKSSEELFAAVGAGDISVHQAINMAQKLFAPIKLEPIALRPAKQKDSDKDLFIEGVGGLLTNIAACCRPVPGDSISGYITLNRGVSIHRADCSNMLQLQQDEPERVISVSWGNQPQEIYSVELSIEGFDRHGLLRDITNILHLRKININAMNTVTDKENNTVHMVLTVEIRSLEELSRVLAKLNQLPNVAHAQRHQ